MLEVGIELELWPPPHTILCWETCYFKGTSEELWLERSHWREHLKLVLLSETMASRENGGRDCCEWLLADPSHVPLSGMGDIADQVCLAGP